MDVFAQPPADQPKKSTLSTARYCSPAADDESPRADQPDRQEILRSFRRDEHRPDLGRRAETDRLREESDQLRQDIAGLRRQLDEAVQKNQAGFEERERDYETLLEEQSEEIRALYMRLQELEASKRPAAPPPKVAPSPAHGNPELADMAAELEQERLLLEEQRQALHDEREQLRQDEDALMERMREMELQTAKSRSEMVRQRSEIQQQYNQIRTELDEARRTGAINERMKLLQREHQGIKG